MTAYFERFDCNKIVPVVSSRQEFSMLHHLLVVPPHFCIGMDWPLSQVAIVTTRIFYIFGLLDPTAITGKGDDPNIWVTGGSRYSRENEHSPLLKWWLGYYLPLEMLPFLGGIRLFSVGVYTFFLSCDSYPSNMFWQSWLSKGDDFWIQISAKVKVEISMFFFDEAVSSLRFLKLYRGEKTFYVSRYIRDIRCHSIQY